MVTFEDTVLDLADWLASPRFGGLVRLHTARQVAEQRSSIACDATVARRAAEAFFIRLRELFADRQSMTTFGPYSPGQAVVMRRLGLEGIYLGGWATSAKGGTTEDPGADLASYPLNQVPDEAAAIVRALVTADRNQQFARARMTAHERAKAPLVDFRPFIIADADTGHGGDAHVRNLIRRFVEAGVPGYHIEDQKPGVKKCGHQGGKVLVAQSEQIQRLNAARFQLDVMGVPGVIVARTDAEAANLIDSNGDERDQPFILGATNPDVPSYKAVVVALHKTWHDAGGTGVRGHLMFQLLPSDLAGAEAWLVHSGLREAVAETAASTGAEALEAAFERTTSIVLDRWQRDARLKTYREAVADESARRGSASPVTWNAELAKTPEGYYQIRGGLAFAIARSLAVAPFADLLWMETATPDIEEARAFAQAIHARFPDKMLAYNLSPSFNWDSKGLSDEEMREFPRELARLGFVFNFITYGGHQIDGLAAEDFTRTLQRDGMLALARLQRKLRLLESPYRTPQVLAGGPRLDAALMACSGRMATTKAMGQGSTHHQHLREIEMTPARLEAWLQDAHPGMPAASIRVELRPAFHDAEGVELTVFCAGQAAARVLIQTMADNQHRRWLAVLNQQVSHEGLVTRTTSMLVTLYLIARYQPATVQYLSPERSVVETARGMAALGVYEHVTSLEGLAVATVSRATVDDLAQKTAAGEFLAHMSRD